MDQNDKDKIAELNDQETEQVVGGVSRNPTGTAVNSVIHGFANLGGGFGLDALRHGTTAPPKPVAE